METLVSENNNNSQIEVIHFTRRLNKALGVPGCSQHTLTGVGSVPQGVLVCSQHPSLTGVSAVPQNVLVCSQHSQGVPVCSAHPHWCHTRCTSVQYTPSLVPHKVYQCAVNTLTGASSPLQRLQTGRITTTRKNLPAKTDSFIKKKHSVKSSPTA